MTRLSDIKTLESLNQGYMTFEEREAMGRILEENRRFREALERIATHTVSVRRVRGRRLVEGPEMPSEAARIARAAIEYE